MEGSHLRGRRHQLSSVVVDSVCCHHRPLPPRAVSLSLHLTMVGTFGTDPQTGLAWPGLSSRSGFAQPSVGSGPTQDQPS